MDVLQQTTIDTLYVCMYIYVYAIYIHTSFFCCCPYLPLIPLTTMYALRKDETEPIVAVAIRKEMWTDILWADWERYQNDLLSRTGWAVFLEYRTETSWILKYTRFQAFQQRWQHRTPWSVVQFCRRFGERYCFPSFLSWRKKWHISWKWPLIASIL
jgi:hypothetical protein